MHSVPLSTKKRLVCFRKVSTHLEIKGKLQNNLLEEKSSLPTASTTTSPRLCSNAPESSCPICTNCTNWSGGRNSETEGRGSAPPLLGKASEQRERCDCHHTPQGKHSETSGSSLASPQLLSYSFQKMLYAVIRSLSACLLLLPHAMSAWPEADAP